MPFLSTHRRGSSDIASCSHSCINKQDHAMPSAAICPANFRQSGISMPNAAQSNQASHLIIQSKRKASSIHFQTFPPVGFFWSGSAQLWRRSCWWKGPLRGRRCCSSAWSSSGAEAEKNCGPHSQGFGHGYGFQGYGIAQPRCKVPKASNQRSQGPLLVWVITPALRDPWGHYCFGALPTHAFVFPIKTTKS